jgi:hypothetical protein
MRVNGGKQADMNQFFQLVKPDFTECGERNISIYHYRLIFGFLLRYPMLSNSKISAYNQIYIIPKLHIPPAHLTNFNPFQISSSGTLSLIGAPIKVFKNADMQKAPVDQLQL